MGELERLITGYLFQNCPDCCMDKQKLAAELAEKTTEMLAERCPEGRCHADIKLYRRNLNAR